MAQSSTNNAIESPKYKSQYFRSASPSPPGHGPEPVRHPLLGVHQHLDQAPADVPVLIHVKEAGGAARVAHTTRAADPETGLVEATDTFLSII